MAKTYEQLRKQIESLQQQAEALRRQELSGVVARIQVAIKAYGLTAADLGLDTAAARTPARAIKWVPGHKRRGPGKKAKAKTSGKSTAPVKFRDETGRSWVGIGKRPQWVRDALAAGKTLADFKV